MHFYEMVSWSLTSLFGTNTAISETSISMRDNENEITYNRAFVVDHSKEDISDCKSLRDVAMATKFWPK